jgi:hypothetical protein
VSVLRCANCRLLVDAVPSSAPRCAACGGPLEQRNKVTHTIWDDDDPTERRPTDYVKRLRATSAR